MNTPIYPDVTVRLTGEDGNAFFMIGRTTAALRQGGADQDSIDKFQDEAMSGDYNHVIQTIMTYVNVE